MKERKYKEDYTIRTILSEKGQEQQEVVYRGEYFHFCGGTQEKNRTLRWSLCCAVVFFACYLVFLKLNTPSSLCIYVMPVSAIAIIPFAYWCMGLFALYRCKDRMTRLQKETSLGRILHSSIGCTIFLAMACTGDVIYMLVSLKERAMKETPGLAFLSCAAIAALSSFLQAKEIYEKMTVSTSKGAESLQ